MCKQTDLSFLEPICFPRFFHEHSRKLPAVNADRRRFDRKPLPPRGRSVVSMKEPLPLYLSHSIKTSSDFPLPSQLRRIQSSPTTFGQAKKSFENIKLAGFPFTNRLFCITKDMQAPAEITASQALFDLGIFQSSGKGSGRSSPSSSSNEMEDDVRQCRSLGSPFEEHRMVDCFEDGDKHSLTNTFRTSGERRSRITFDKSDNVRVGGNSDDNVMIATSRAMNGSNHSLNSGMVEEESSSLIYPSETSWLDDPSDDEEDYSSSSQCSLAEVQSPDLDASETMNIDFGSEKLHEPSIVSSSNHFVVYVLLLQY